MAIDWDNMPARQWRFRFDLVQPLDMTKVVGELEGVDASSVTITEDWDSDTQAQAKLTFYGNGGSTYDRNAFVRIVAMLADGSYEEALGTFIPRNDAVTVENGIRKTTLTLESTIYGMSREHMPNGLTIAAGASAQSVWRQIFNKLGRQYRELSGWQNRNYSVAQYIDRGTTYLDALKQIMDDSNNRLSVDGNGYVTIWRRRQYRYEDETFKIDANSSNVANGVSRSSNELSRISGLVAIANKTENNVDKSISALLETGARTRAQIGYLETKKQTYSDLNPFDVATLQSRAFNDMATEASEDLEWTFDMLYNPQVQIGMIGSYIALDDLAEYTGSHKVICTGRDIKLSNMTMSVTLKSVYSYYFGVYH